MILLSEELTMSSIVSAIDRYRDVIEQRDQVCLPERQKVYGDIAVRLRRLWKERIGLDNLHDIACGEVLHGQQ